MTPSLPRAHGSVFYVFDVENDHVVAGPMTYDEACHARDIAVQVFGREYAIRREGDYA